MSLPHSILTALSVTRRHACKLDERCSPILSEICGGVAVEFLNRLEIAIVLRLSGPVNMNPPSI
jgi:hypothetical protein